MREILSEWSAYPECNSYGASKDGRVCSFDYKHTGKTKELVQHIDKYGYKYVFMKINGRKVKRLVHRIVLSAFVDNPENKPQVNHKNGVRTDNNIENLEWCTASENCLHGYRVNGRKNSKCQIETARGLFSSENNPKSKITEDIARQIVSERKNGSMLKEIAAKYKISVSQVSAICNGKFWKDIFDNPKLIGE